jgi:hypothetical protein
VGEAEEGEALMAFEAIERAIGADGLYVSEIEAAQAELAAARELLEALKDDFVPTGGRVHRAMQKCEGKE